MRLRPGWLNRLADRIEPDWLGERDWWSWIAHRLIVGIPTLLAWWLHPIAGVVVAWVGTLIYAHDEGAVRNWSWSNHTEKPWVWDGIMDVPLDLALLATGLLLWGAG